VLLESARADAGPIKALSDMVTRGRRAIGDAVSAAQRAGAVGK
jgi:hypothetical protein